MKLYLDDQFFPVGSFLLLGPRMGGAKEIYLTEWHIVRNYHQFISTITNHHPSITHISFDFDLDLHSTYQGKTGLDCATWTKEFYEKHELPLPNIYIHSRNIYGVQSILNVFPEAMH